MPSPAKPVFVRQQLLIDRIVQGSLLRRAALYFAACLVYFVVILVFAEGMARQEDTWVEAIIGCFDEAIYWAPGLMLLTPLVAYDMLKLTNRFAGPMFRLRREMQRLIDDQSERPLSFRDGDYWTEMPPIFNQIRTELMELREDNRRLKQELAASNNLTTDASPSQLFSADTADSTEQDNLLNSFG